MATDYERLGTIDDLRRYTGASSVVQVLGARIAGDGGGGLFMWDSLVPPPVESSVFLDDNRGIVITSADPARSGRWRRVGFRHRSTAIAGEGHEAGSEPINVKWFGAVGDRETDDLGAIQAAVDAAVKLTSPAAPIAPPSSYCRPAVFFPTGMYAVSQPIEVPRGIALVGESLAALTPTPDKLGRIPLVRVEGPLNDIDTMTFVGGLHSIALFGVTRKVAGVFPDASGVRRSMNVIFHPAPGNYPCRIRNCTFHYPKGPAIWQDTGRRGDVFTEYDLFRSFHVPVIVSQFHFVGPHLFWGTGDMVVFENGHVGWDQVNVDPEITGDGLPLGCVNSAGNLWMRNCAFYPLGAGEGRPEWSDRPTRKAVFTGSGNVLFLHCASSDRGGIVLARARVESNTYQGAAPAPVRLPVDRDPVSHALLTRLSLTIKDSCLAFSDGTNWLEIYELFPRLISLDPDPYDPAQGFQRSLGIWVHRAHSAADERVLLARDMVNLEATLRRHKYDQWIALRGFSTHDQFRIRASAEAHVHERSGANVTDITSRFVQYLEEPERLAADMTPRDNLFLSGLYDAGHPDIGGGGTPGLAGDFTDTGTGYTLQGWTAASNGEAFGFFTKPWSTYPHSDKQIGPGVYVFSFYIKTSFAGQIVLVYEHVDPLAITLASQVSAAWTRFFPASNGYQRLSFPFYFPGPPVSYRFACRMENIPRGGRVSAGFFCINEGIVPAPYRFPAGHVPPRTANVTSFTATACFYGPDRPTSGTFIKGDIVYNTDPGLRGPVGWVCIAGTDEGGPKFRAFGEA